MCEVRDLRRARAWETCGQNVRARSETCAQRDLRSALHALSKQFGQRNDQSRQHVAAVDRLLLGDDFEPVSG